MSFPLFITLTKNSGKEVTVRVDTIAYFEGVDPQNPSAGSVVTLEVSNRWMIVIETPGQIQSAIFQAKSDHLLNFAPLDWNAKQWLKDLLGFGLDMRKILERKVRKQGGDQ